MPQFILAYHGGKQPETPEQGAKHMQQWKAWLGDLGAAVVNPGMALPKAKTVTRNGVADDGGPNRMVGLTILQAQDMAAAVELAKRCPTLDIDGTVVVSEVKQM